MLPRSSMATSRFTRTFFAARAFEPAERLTVTMAGIISGAMPTAMASEKSSASMRGRDSATLTMKMNAVSTAATSNRKRENRDRPASKAVWPCFSARPAAICPKAVRAPVRTTTPRADPWWTIVPMKAHPGWSSGWRPVTGAADLATGIDSPVSTPFVALELVDLQQAEVGRNEVADAERHHVAGHEVRHRDPARPSVPANLGLLSDLGAERGHRHLRPVLVEEAQSDAEGDDHGDDHRVRAAAGQPRHQRRPEQEDQDRVADLAEEDSGGAHPVRAERVRPELAAAVPPHRRTRAHPCRFPAVGALPRATGRQRQPNSNSPGKARATVTMQAPSLRRLVPARAIGHHHGRRSGGRDPSASRGSRLRGARAGWCGCCLVPPPSVTPRPGCGSVPPVSISSCCCGAGQGRWSHLAVTSGLHAARVPRGRRVAAGRQGRRSPGAAANAPDRSRAAGSGWGQESGDTFPGPARRIN